MLKKGRQRAHFNEVWQSMLAHLLAFYETQDPEALHQFRVQVKKIKAMSLFWQDNARSKELKALRSIFRHAGNIRSAWINLCFFDQYQLTAGAHKRAQENILVRETRRLFAKRKVYLRTLEKIRPVLAGQFRDAEDGTVIRFYQKRLQKIARVFVRTEHTVEGLHQTRKKIKNLLYLHACLSERLVQKLKLDTDNLDQLQDAIGKWHDVVLAVELLKKEGFSDKKILAGLERRGKRLYNNINALSEGFSMGAEK
ncbi:MAG: CHAD domain-containing protein [Haliscomenobacteraceae bacterium CHB4]|nr:hypothetical protein [Saprospiraceae bacterium]MCE7926310.1 CHAD domain-containing protein [Haliscomenobacteraceae bacterium CHB4]